MAAVAAVNALAAWVGAIGLVGGLLDFGDLNDRLPFDSLVLAGVALALVVALPSTALARSAWIDARSTDGLALVVGGLLIGWIVVQLAVLRALSFFHPTYFGIGAYFVAASHRVRLGRLLGGTMLVAVGAVVLAAGVGFAPHLIANGLTPTGGLSAVLVSTGLVIVVAGARHLARGRSRLEHGGAAFGTLIAVALAVWSIAPPVAATHVRDTHVSATPEDLGLPYDSVTLTTRDGVELAAWLIEGDNGAGVVMLHGAGSTRSDVLDQAAVLAEHGYTLLLLDARGHGDSRGTAMDFGWYGDLDVGAGTDFLAERDDLDPDRIGVVGFSMGGEEAIGAAGTDPRIRAVVAEGATGRQAADKAWYSDTYGWRGWLQEQLETIQLGITDLLTDASPPPSLRSAVRGATDTAFLLVTAGGVQDEGHAAAWLASAGGDRVDVWTVDGAGHAGGLDTQPEQWERRVVGFLDAHLLR